MERGEFTRHRDCTAFLAAGEDSESLEWLGLTLCGQLQKKTVPACFHSIRSVTFRTAFRISLQEINGQFETTLKNRLGCFGSAGMSWCRVGVE